MAHRATSGAFQAPHANLHSVNALELSGIEHMRIGDLTEAERDMTDAMTRRGERFPNEPNHAGLSASINNLAVLHLKQRRFEEAAAGFERVIAINEQLQQRTPSTRLALEIESAKKNLAATQRLLANEAQQSSVVLANAMQQPLLSDPMLLPATDATAGALASDPSTNAAAAAAAGWAAVKASVGSDVLKTTNRKHKEQIAKKLGVDTSGMKEADLDAAIRRSVQGGNLAGGNVEGEALRISIGMAFDLLDEDGDGAVSRGELLKGLKSKPRVRDVLQLGPLADPAEFDAIYRSIDQDASNTIDRREFESFFLRRLAPMSQAYPPASGVDGLASLQNLARTPAAGPASAYGPSARERELQLTANAAMRFMQAGAAHGSASRQTTPASGSASSISAIAPYDNGGWGSGTGGLRLTTPNQELADVTRYDEATRRLEASHHRKIGLQRDLLALQGELRAVEADILSQAHLTHTLKAALLQHKAAHGSAAEQIEQRLRVLDREANLAARPHLRTAARHEVP